MKNEIDSQLKMIVDSQGAISLKQAVLDEKHNKINYQIISQNVLTKIEKSKLEAFFSSITPIYLETKFTYLRVFADKDNVFEAVKSFFEQKHHRMLHFVDLNNMQYDPASFSIKFSCEKLFFDDMQKLIPDLREWLAEKFFKDFQIIVDCFEDADVADIQEEIVHYVLPKRVIKIEDRVKLFGKEIEGYPQYICDIKTSMPEGIICGKISYYQKNLTKEGKPYYTFALKDFTGTARGVIFANKTVDKSASNLLNDMEVLVSGEIKVVDKRKEIIVKSMSHCSIPSQIVEEKKISLPAPAKYSKVFPEEFHNFVQENLLKKEEINQNLMGKTFICFDLETTGFYCDSDKITEIGACKLKDGVIIETFQTLIDPEVNISQRITDITGIDNFMVAGKPKIYEVMADFFKFCEGCILVAHNISFDMSFLRENSEKCDYIFENETEDTLLVSRNRLPRLSNHKLGTVAEFLQIEPMIRHRALADALTCAEILKKIY